MKTRKLLSFFRGASFFFVTLFWLTHVPANGQNCDRTSVGLAPLIELGTGLYQGYQGGLYPNGSNFIPAAHFSAGLELAAQVMPRNPAGVVDVSTGKIVLLSIGMSNTTQEFSEFKRLANAERMKNAKLVIVDGAQGGQTAAIISDSTANFWRVIEQRLSDAGVTTAQVQVAWVKESDARPSQTFPTHAQILTNEFEKIARILKAKYPNLKLAYWSSRIYAGYATTNLNPEPFAYESGFAVKWLLEKQIRGDTALAFAGSKPQAPWLAWGPYLWADGITPRRDGLIWECRDFNTDGTHPSPSGRTKVAQLLLNFFKSDSTARGWFLQPPTTHVEDKSGSIPSAFSLKQNYPNPFNPGTVISFQLPMNSHVTLKVFEVNGREVATLVEGEMNAGNHAVTFTPRHLAGGIYFYRLSAGKFSQTRQAILMK